MLKNEKKCGCFYCCKIFSPNEIEDWCEDEPDRTAICPYCWIDSVIGESFVYFCMTKLLHTYFGFLSSAQNNLAVFCWKIKNIKTLTSIDIGCIINMKSKFIDIIEVYRYIK